MRNKVAQIQETAAICAAILIMVIALILFKLGGDQSNDKDKKAKP